jgi:aspartate aminotransferase
VSGCAALMLVSHHLQQQPIKQNLVLLEPTWANHSLVFGKSAKIKRINMYDQKTNGFKFDEVVEALNSRIANGSNVLFQACAQNPTGVDPTEEQWIALSKICKDKQLTPIIDAAYLGFVSGDFVKDAFPLRLFADDGHDFFFCQSFSKNMGLYGERLGCLHVVCKDSEKAAKVTKYFE